ncbi:MAG: hypothetical protein H0T90_01165, partial [Gemmatimonadales bacterium]|nr:hypothetical protein [Gemmatimonadales bacterium]
MPQSLLLSSLAGVAAGLIVAAVFIVLYTRRQRRDATGVLELARVEAERHRADARREAEAARSQVLLSAKMDTFKLREDLER